LIFVSETDQRCQGKPVPWMGSRFPFRILKAYGKETLIADAMGKRRPFQSKLDFFCIEIFGKPKVCC
jgi:hypothetical protein